MSVENDIDGHYSDTEYDLDTRDITASFASLSDELKCRESTLSAKQKDLRQLKIKLNKRENELKLKETKIK